MSSLLKLRHRWPLVWLLLTNQLVLSQVQPSERYSSTFYSINTAMEHEKEATGLQLNSINRLQIPQELSKLTNLKELVISYSDFKYLPDSVHKLTKLRTLKLYNCRYVDWYQLFEGLARIPSLRELEISECKILQIPANIKKLQKLTHLNLSGNDMKSLSTSVGDLKDLQAIDISNNALSELPGAIMQCNILQHVNLKMNPELQLKKVLTTLAELPNLAYLELSDVNRLPAVIGDLGSLQKLFLSNSRLQTVPRYFENLVQLRELSLENCDQLDLDQLLGLGNISKQLRKLEIIGETPIQFPNTISRLDRLQVLKLDYNNYTVFSTALEWPESLTELFISGLKVPDYQVLFEAIEKSNLENVHLQNIGLTDLPENILTCQGVHKFDFRGNEIAGYPESLSKLDSLQELNLSGNPISDEQTTDLHKQLPDCRIITDNSIKTTGLAAIDPPVPSLDIMPETITIENTDKDIEMTTSTGTKLKIPANAFIYADGTSVEGPVNVSYREFTDPLDIALSGIPMTYAPEGGEEGVFASAGMFELYASQGNKPLQLATDKAIDVIQTTPWSGTDYNFYVMDTGAGTWSDASSMKFNVQKMDSLDLRLQALQQLTKLRSPTWPGVPDMGLPIKEDVHIHTFKKGSKSKYRFSFTGSIEHKTLPKEQRKRVIHYPEMTVLKKIKWIYDGDDVKATYRTLDSLRKLQKKYVSYRSFGKQKKFYKTFGMTADAASRKYGTSLVETIKVTPDTTTDNFRITLVFMEDTLDIPAYPAVMYGHDERKQKKYARAYTRYQALAQDNAARWKQIKAYQLELQKIYEESMNTLRAQNASYLRTKDSLLLLANTNSLQTGNASRTARVNQLGMCNWDRLMQEVQNQLATIKTLKLKDENHNELDIARVYVMDETRNSVSVYPSLTVEMLPDTYYSILAITRDGKVAVCERETVKRLLKPTNAVTLYTRVFAPEALTNSKLKAIYDI